MNERYGILPKMTTVCDTNMTENDFALSSLFGFVDTLLGESGVQQMYDTWFSLDYLDEIDAESEPNLTQNVNIDITIEPTSIKSVENSQSRNDIVRHPVDSQNGKSWIRAPRIATANSGLSAQSPNNVNVQAGATRAGASRISERFTRPIMENLTRLYRFYNSITSENNKILQSLPEMKFNISNPKAVDNRNPSVTSNNNTPKINSTANGFELIERLIKHNRNHIEQFRFLEQLNYAKAGAAEKISKLENQTRDEKVRGQAFTSSQIDPKSNNISVKYIDYIRSSEYPTVRLENAVRQTARLQDTPSHRGININNPTISGNTGNDKNEAKQGARVVSNVKNNQSYTELSRDTAQSIGQEKARDLTDKLTIAHKESEIPEQRLSTDIANLSAKQIELPKVISDSDSAVGASDTVRKINTAGSDADDINIRFANKITSGNHISAGQLHPQLLNSRKINADKIKTSGIADFGGNIYERSAHGFVSAISPENSTYIYNEINKPFSVEYLTNTDDTGMSGSTKVISSDLTVGPDIVNNTYESTAPQSTSGNIANKSDSGELVHVANEKVPVSISQRNDEKAPQNTLKREVYRIKSVTRNTSGNVQFPEGMSFNEYFNNPQYYMNYGAYSADGTRKSLIHNIDGAVAAGNKTNDILLSTEGRQNNIAQNSAADIIPHGGEIKDGGNVRSSSESSEDITNLTEQYTQNLQNNAAVNENNTPTDITYLRQDGDTNIDDGNVNSSSDDITNLTEQYTQNLQNSVVTNENIAPTDITYLRQDGDTNIDGDNVNSSSEDITKLTEQYTQNIQNSAAANNITPVDIAYLHNPETTQLAGTVTDVNNTDSTRNVNIAEDKSPAKNRLHAYRSLSDLKLGMNNTFFDNRSSRVLNNKMTALRNENISSVNNISLQNEPQYVANELNKQNSTVSPNDLGGYTAAVSMRHLQSEPNIVSELQNTNATDIVTKSIASDNNVERNNPAKASIMESETESNRTRNGLEKTSENQLRTVGQRGNTLIQNNAANENTSNDILENTHNSSVDMMRESEPARLIYLEPENPARESDTAKSPTRTFGKRQYIESEYVKKLPSWARSFLRDSFNAEYAQTSVKKAGLSNDQNLTKFNISGLNEGRLKSNKGTFERRATQMSNAVMGAASEARDDNLRFMYDKALPDSVEGNRLNSGAPHAFSAVQPNNRYRNPSHIARPKMIEWNAPLQNSGSAIPNPTAVYSHPVDLSLKSSEKLENTNAVQSRIDTSVRTKLSQSASQRGYSEAEIHRMAEKVYSIIEKRLKTERRRLGL